MAGRRRRDIATAQAEARVRYDPTVRTLTALLQDAKDELQAGVKQANYGAKATARAVAAARPVMEKVYQDAGAGQGEAKAVLDQDLRSLSAAADPYKAASAREAAGASRRLHEAASQALAGLTERAVGAQAGRQYAVQKARSDYQASRAKIGDQLLGVQSDAGAYVAGRVGDISEKRAGRRVTTRGQDLSHADRVADREARERREREKGKEPKKPKWATPQKQGEVQDLIKQAEAAAKRLKSTGLSREQVAQVLMMGDPEAGIPNFGNRQLLAQVGLDVAFSGHITPQNARELRKRRIRVKALGYRTKPLPSYSDRARANEVAGPPMPRPR